MTIRELYAEIGGNYDEVIGRLRMDKLVERFIVRVLDDTSCQELQEAWEQGDMETAFHAAHTAKGVWSNLALTELADLASRICEALRPGNEALLEQTDVDALVSELAQAYEHAAARIKQFATSA